VNRRRASGLVLATILTCLALAACTNTVSGNPGASSASDGGSAPPSSATTVDPFAGVNLCALVDQGVAGQGFPPAQVDPDIKSKRQCITKKPELGTVGIVVQVNVPYNSYFTAGASTKTGSVNDRPAVQVAGGTDDPFGCDIYMEVKPNSRAIVGDTLSTGTADDACVTARQIATKIEPLLPKNN
jgi:hypothetical protein